MRNNDSRQKQLALADPDEDFHRNAMIVILIVSAAGIGLPLFMLAVFTYVIGLWP